MSTLINDLRYAIRILSQRPGFTAIIASTLALGIGFVTMMFSVIDGALLKPLPYQDQDRLVRIWEESSQDPLTAIGAGHVSMANCWDYRERSQCFQDMALVGGSSETVRYQNRSELLRTLAVTANFFDLLGLHPARGRLFADEDQTDKSPQHVILTHKGWNTWFQRDPNVVGQSILLDEANYLVIGILPATFVQPVYPMYQADLLMPFDLHTAGKHREARRYSAIGRLQDGVSLNQARVEVGVFSQQLMQSYPQANEGYTFRAKSLRSTYSGEVDKVLYLLMGAAGVLLLIACTNAASLLLIRGLHRRQETVIRQALGAGRMRIVQQFTMEGSVLALLSVPLGVMVAMGGIGLLRPMILDLGPRGV